MSYVRSLKSDMFFDPQRSDVMSEDIWTWMNTYSDAETVAATGSGRITEGFSGDDERATEDQEMNQNNDGNDQNQEGGERSEDNNGNSSSNDETKEDDHEL